jgi:hypothetical protein
MSSRIWSVPRLRRAVLAGVLWLVAGGFASAQQSPATLSPVQQREFLMTAKVVGSRPAGKGVTGTLRLTLSDGTVTHDAGFQTIDDRMTTEDRVRGKRKAGEYNFVDSYKYNVAAYEIARLIGVDDMMPVTVERRINGETGSLSWWMDDVMMDEMERDQKNAQPPSAMAFARQFQRMTVFGELLRDVDRNKTNILYTSDWRHIMIDFSRAFRLDRELRFPDSLQQCDRTLYEKLKALTEPEVRKAVGALLTSHELAGVMARRKLIVERFDRLIRERGEATVLY